MGLTEGARAALVVPGLLGRIVVVGNQQAGVAGRGGDEMVVYLHEKS